MKRCIKSWIIHYFNISLILIFIVVGGLNAQTSKSNSNNDSLQVKDNFVHEELSR